MLITNIEKTVNNFKINISLHDDECGMSGFHSKWTRDDQGLIQGDDSNWTCEHYNVSVLTQASAQSEFNRDCEAFDVSLMVTVSKNNIELVDECVVGSDYNWNDSDPEKLLNDLVTDYYDEEHMLTVAKNVLKNLCEC